MKTGEFVDKLLLMTSPEETGEKAQDWNERIYQIAKESGYNLKMLSEVAWACSPMKVAFDIVSAGERWGKGLDKLLSIISSST